MNTLRTIYDYVLAHTWVSGAFLWLCVLILKSMMRAEPGTPLARVFATMDAILPFDLEKMVKVISGEADKRLPLPDGVDAPTTRREGGLEDE